MPGSFRRSPGCQCCGLSTCILLEDSFNRMNSGDVGGDWDELSGDWSIELEKLKCVSDGEIRSAAGEPTAAAPHGQQIITVFVDAIPSATFSAEIRADWDPVVGSFRFARIRYVSPYWYIMVGIFDGVVETIIEGRQVYNWVATAPMKRVKLHFCSLASHLYLNAWFIRSPDSPWDTIETMVVESSSLGGRYHGLDATAGVAFNDYAAALAYRTDGRESCPNCGPGASCLCGGIADYLADTWFYPPPYGATGCETACLELGTYSSPLTWAVTRIIQCLWRSADLSLSCGATAYFLLQDVTSPLSLSHTIYGTVYIRRDDIGPSPIIPPIESYTWRFTSSGGGGTSICFGVPLLYPSPSGLCNPGTSVYLRPA